MMCKRGITRGREMSNDALDYTWPPLSWYFIPTRDIDHIPEMWGRERRGRVCVKRCACERVYMRRHV